MTLLLCNSEAAPDTGIVSGHITGTLDAISKYKEKHCAKSNVWFQDQRDVTVS